LPEPAVGVDRAALSKAKVTQLALSLRTKFPFSNAYNLPGWPNTIPAGLSGYLTSTRHGMAPHNFFAIMAQYTKINKR